ncbi:DUF2953 domain-containing protein [Sulfoacidibacillus thermotolerans]|uniref:DUF2953 domain-containing protein n=1 Tax=Sulfoacidibacillus thermotolerans TaxID=1765684 RepID=A0A2U3D5Q8_SULT2|nr:DUF2953 domain-containing protein [Sulfoacidibacillus thermotolerans]PWI56614.1 hypothetical protein BM613_12815 [Sulfoacidibacillus thermotolerans]
MLWWTLIIVALFGIVLFAPIRFEVRYEHHQPIEQVHIFIRYLYLVRIHREWAIPTPSPETLVTIFSSRHVQQNPNIHPDVKKLDKRKQQIQRLTFLLTHIDEAGPILIQLTRKISILELSWTTTLGTGNAALTGMGCGFAWTLKSMIVGVLTEACSFRKPPFLSIQPNYYTALFKTSLSCIGTVSIGKTMFAGARLLWLLKMGGAHARTSDPISNANRDGKS